ncbi:MAG: CorA family divalent cation transporter [Gammaproteobacteria bacterium]
MDGQNTDDDDDDGLVFAFDLDGKGGGRPLSWAELDDPKATFALPWIHLHLESERACQWLREESGMDSAIIDAILDGDTRPRCVEHEAGLLAILRGVNLNPGEIAEDMVALRIWLEKAAIVTTRRRTLQSIRVLAEDVRAGRGPKSPGDFLVRLSAALGNRIEPIVDILDEELELAEENFAENKRQAYAGQFSQLRRRAAKLRRYLGPQREAYQAISRHGTGLLSSEQAFEIQEDGDRVTRLLEDLDLVRERAMVAQEELLGRMAQQQNDRMYILAIVSAIFLPLAFLSGLFGMNVAGLPGTQDPLGFVYTMLGMFAAAVGIGVLFRWKGWL